MKRNILDIFIYIVKYNMEKNSNFFLIIKDCHKEKTKQEYVYI